MEASPGPVTGGGISQRRFDTTRRPTLIVAAIIAALFFGSPIVNEAIPGTVGEVEAGAPIPVGTSSSITPTSGWTASELNGGGTRLEKGAVVLDLFEVRAANGRELAQAYLDEALIAQSTELTTSAMEMADGAGSSAARFTYQGLFIGAEGAIEGEVTAIVSTDAGLGVVADAWSPRGRLVDLLEEARAMIESIEVGT
jgi:hypothetical protein